MISIPVWFDWKNFSERASLRNELISIPVWFDWKSQATPVSIYITGISIPVWFDWKLRSSTGYVVAKEFQFQFGSIGSFYTFNSHIRSGEISIPVWFDWKAPPEMRLLELSVISIPVWFDWKPR